MIKLLYIIFDYIRTHNSLMHTEIQHYAYLNYAKILYITKHENIAKEYGCGKYIPTNIASIHGHPANSKEEYYILAVYKDRIESKYAKSIPKELKNLCIKLRDSPDDLRTSLWRRAYV